MGKSLFFDNILNMKDTSELMVNLAYSALLYHNREIAEEVLKMEEIMDELHEKVRLQALSSVKEGEDIPSAEVLLRIASSTEVIADAAMSIADVVLRDIDPHPVIRMSLMESDTTITAGTIGKRSSLAEATIKDNCIASETGMWILAVRRGREWIYGPDENTLLHAGDVVLAKGPKDSISYFREVLSGKEKI